MQLCSYAISSQENDAFLPNENDTVYEIFWSKYNTKEILKHQSLTILSYQGHKWGQERILAWWLWWKHYLACGTQTRWPDVQLLSVANIGWHFLVWQKMELTWCSNRTPIWIFLPPSCTSTVCTGGHRGQGDPSMFKERGFWAFSHLGSTCHLMTLVKGGKTQNIDKFTKRYSMWPPTPPTVG